MPWHDFKLKLIKYNLYYQINENAQKLFLLLIKTLSILPEKNRHYTLYEFRNTHTVVYNTPYIHSLIRVKFLLFEFPDIEVNFLSILILSED